MKLVDAFRRILLNTDSTAESLRALVAGCANQSDLVNRKFDQVIAGFDNQSDLLNHKLNRVIDGVSGIARKLTPVDTNDAGESQPSPEDWKVEVRDLRPIVDGSEFSAFGAATTESVELLLSSAAYND